MLNAPAVPRLASQGSAKGCLGGTWRAANDVFSHIGNGAHATFSGLIKALANRSAVLWRSVIRAPESFLSVARQSWKGFYLNVMVGSVLLSACGSSKEDEHAADLGGEDEDNFGELSSART